MRFAGVKYGAIAREAWWHATVGRTTLATLRGRIRRFDSRKAALAAARKAAGKRAAQCLMRALADIGAAVLLMRAIPPELVTALRASSMPPSFYDNQARLPGGSANAETSVAVDVCETVGIPRLLAFDVLDAMWRNRPRARSVRKADRS